MTATPEDSADDVWGDPERWRHALDNAEDGLWDWSADTGRVFRSARCLTMLGYPPGEVRDTLEAWHELVHPDDRERQTQAIREHVAGRDPGYKVEYRLRRADGSWCWVLDRGKVVRWAEDGRPQRVVGTHTDISAYKDLEQRLREREALLDGAQRVGRIGSWAWDADTGEVWWSPELFSILGLPEGRDAPRWEDQVHFYTPESYARLAPLMQRAARGGDAFDTELEMLRADGERRVVELCGGCDSSPSSTAGGRWPGPVRSRRSGPSRPRGRAAWRASAPPRWRGAAR